MKRVRHLHAYLSYPHPSGLHEEGKPLPKQLLIHHYAKRYRHRLYMAGVGSGKTLCGAYDVFRHVLTQPRCTGLIISPTIKMLRAVVIRKLQYVLERIRQQTGQVVAKISVDRGEMLFTNGTMVYLRSADRPDLLEGLEVTWLWFDESEICTHPATVYDILHSRLREGALPPIRHPKWWTTLVTTTPSDKPDGIVQHFMHMIQEGSQDHVIVRMSTLENPYLPAEFVGGLRRQYSPRLFEQRVEGKILEKTGAILGKYLRLEPWDPRMPEASGNLIDWRPRRDLPIWIGIDWGYRHPHALWYQYGTIGGQPDTGVVFHEFWKDDCTLEELIRYIVSYHRQTGLHITGFVVDPGGNTSKKGRKMLRKVFRCGQGPYAPKLRWPYKDDARNIDIGLEVLRTRLVRGDGVRRLLFSTDLDLRTDVRRDGGNRGVIVCAKNLYRWKELQGGIWGSVPDKDDIADHSIDTLRYLQAKLHPHTLEEVAAAMSGGFQDWYDEAFGVAA